jgi:putative ABC transport system permease protein
MRQDLRFALRMIAAHRWFSAAVVVTLALGIGLNTMVFTLVNAALLKPVPVPGGERLVAIRSISRAPDGRRMDVSGPDFRDYRAQATSLDALEAAEHDSAILSDATNAPEHFRMNRISSGLFRMLRMRPVRGRDFQPEDEKPGAPPVVLLGYGLWKSRYGSADDIAGRVVRVNGRAATVIGVMPEGFRFPDNEDLWMPLAPTAEREDRFHRSLQLFGMLKPGVTLTQAGADLEAIAARLAAEFPTTNKDTGAIVQTFHQRYNGDQIKTVFSMMMAAVGFVLLIACANVANMMLSRALARHREMSIRAALGATRWQVVRQLLTESLLLSVLGGTLGLGLAGWGVHAFSLATQDVGKPYWVQFTMEYSVFGYFAGICVGSALLFGLAPALRSSRVGVNTAIKDGARTMGSPHGGRLSSVLVVFQFALTLVLLVGAGVFMRSLIDKNSLNRWLPADHVMTARVSLPKERYPDAAGRVRFFEQLLTRVSAIPGVSSAAVGSDLPGTGSGRRHIETESSPLHDPAHGPSASVLVQSPGYFRVIGLPLVRGRDFNATDGAAGRPVSIVTRAFAAHYWPGQDAVGKRLRFYENDKPGEWISVTGVSGDMVQQPMDAAPDPPVFLPYLQDSYDSMALLIRTAGNSPSVVPAVRRAVQDLDRDLPLFEVMTLAGAVERQFWFLRLFGTVFLVFALVALVIASVGIYAVMAQAAAGRTQEIGVRVALGATSGNIIRLVLRRGVLQLVFGLGIGLVAAIPAGRAMTGLSFLTSPSDPVLFAAVGLLLAAVGVFACWLPARRAAALHPVSALRNE